MPGDVTGSLVYDARTAEFSFRAGPGLHQPAARRRDQPDAAEDPGRRCSRRWRSGRSPSTATPRPLPDPFVVRATQNPVEYEGTYPLPEAQLDRFLLKLTMPLPAARRGDQVLHAARRRASTRATWPPPGCARSPAPADLRRRRAPPSRAVQRRARGARRTSSTWPGPPATSPSLPLGVSPRGATALLAAARAWAWLSGRDYVTPDDVKALARPDAAAPGRAAARGRARGRHRRRACSTASSPPSPSPAEPARRRWR